VEQWPLRGQFEEKKWSTGGNGSIVLKKNTRPRGKEFAHPVRRCQRGKGGPKCGGDWPSATGGQTHWKNLPKRTHCPVTQKGFLGVARGGKGGDFGGGGGGGAL